MTKESRTRTETTTSPPPAQLKLGIQESYQSNPRCVSSRNWGPNAPTRDRPGSPTACWWYVELGCSYWGLLSRDHWLRRRSSVLTPAAPPVAGGDSPAFGSHWGGHCSTPNSSISHLPTVPLRRSRRWRRRKLLGRRQFSGEQGEDAGPSHRGGAGVRGAKGSRREIREGCWRLRRGRSGIEGRRPSSGGVGAGMGTRAQEEGAVSKCR